MNNLVNIKYTLEAVKNRLEFHKRRLVELQAQNYNKTLQDIHRFQINRFEGLLATAEEQGWTYIN
jgi:hypothetical protein